MKHVTVLANSGTHTGQWNENQNQVKKEANLGNSKGTCPNPFNSRWTLQIHPGICKYFWKFSHSGAK